MNDSTWITVTKRKQNQKRNYLNSVDGRNFETGRPHDPTTFINDDAFSDIEDSEDNENIILESPMVWHKFALIGEVDRPIELILNKYNIRPCSEIGQLKEVVQRISASNCEWSSYTFECENDLKRFSIQSGRKLKFISIIPNFTTREYGKGKELYFVHVRYDQYFVAENNPNASKEMEHVPGYFGFLGDKPTNVPVSIASANVDDNRVNFMRIMKIVEGKMKNDKFQEAPKEQQNSVSKKPYYDPLTKEDLMKYQHFIYKCKLYLEDAYSGYGVILDTKNLDRKIYLFNRRNCFQAFNHDIVNILTFPRENYRNPKIEHEIWSGRVISVEESKVKPINKIFLCKLSYGQANYMIPICGTIPTIEVDNNQAVYLVKQSCHDLIDGLRMVSGIENLMQRQIPSDQSKSFADKCFVTLKCLNEDLTTKFVRIQYVDCYRCEFIFLVLYKEWKNNRRFPYGDVVGLYTPDASFSKTLPLIAVSCDLSVVSMTEEGQLDAEIVKLKRETKKYRMRKKDKSKERPNRSVFSFKYKNQSFHEVAYSYEDLGDGTFRLGTHVVHVGKHVKKDEFFDKMSRKQFFTFLLPSIESESSDTKPLYLFSEKVNNEIFSLNKTRTIDVISVYFVVNDQNFIVSTDLTLVLEPLMLTEEIEVDPFSNIKDAPSYFELIYSTCCKHRISRMNSQQIPHDWFYPDFSPKMSIFYSIIVEEMEFIANNFVRNILVKSEIFFPVTVEETISHDKQLTEWTDTVKEECCVRFFPTLHKRFNFLVSNVTKKIPIRFSGQLLEEIYKTKDTLNWIKCDMLFPDVSFYFYKLANVIDRNGVMARTDAGDSPFSVSFTKPLSCFCDVLLQRVLTCFRNSQQSLYNDEEIADTCTTYRHNKSIFERYWSICRAYEIRDKFGEKSFSLDCVFDDVTEDKIMFHHPFLRDVNTANFIFFEGLGLSEVKLQTNSSVTSPELEWEKRIFIYGQESSNVRLRLPFVLRDIYSYEAYGLREKITSSKLTPIDKQKLNEIKSQNNYPKEMTSETVRLMDPKLKLILKLQEKQILRIQFNYDYSLGIMKIIPEILIVNPHLRPCLGHRKDPFKYFIHPNTLSRINYNRFQYIDAYKDQFRILNRIEGIWQTISEGASYVIHNIAITWIATRGENPQDDVYGIVLLDHDWCMERFIKLGHKNLRIQDPVNTTKKAVDYCQMEFLACIQCFMREKNVYWLGHAQVSDVAYVGNKSMKEIQLTLRLIHSNFPFKEIESQLYSLEIMETPITARVLDRSLRKLKVNSFAERIVMDTVTNKNNNFVQIDYDSEINAFMECRYQLNDAQNKALRIAISREFSLIWGPPGTGKTMVGCIIAFAFTQIKKRPSSTSKSTVLYCGPSNQSVDVVAEKLMNTFGEKCPKLLRIFSSDTVNADFPYPSAIINHETSHTKEFLKPIALHHIVRLPGKPFADKFKKYDKFFKENKERDKVDRKTFAKIVLKYQEKLKLAFINEAEVGGYDIVLCTTVGACRKLIDSFTVTQVIIDECGMCSEPEAIGPILDRKDLINTVFIGDHKQLRPIITAEAAKGKMLNRSLFERIYSSARDYCTMLDTQYRMHPSICEFPSNAFYKERDTKLKTALCHSWSGIPDSYIEDPTLFNGLQYRGVSRNYQNALKKNYINIADKLWKGNRKSNFGCYPYGIDFSDTNHQVKEKILFINVEGSEINQTVSGSSGHVKSKANKGEIKAVECLYRHLIVNIDNKKIASQLVLVITQYRLQEHLLKNACADVLKELKVEGSPRVATVVTSQGSECDYVIFSTVRTLPNKKDIDINPSPGWITKYLGFITDKNQFNVAITRARKGLFIFGNMHLLSVNSNWKALINDLEHRGCIVPDIFGLV